ncbi:MAG: 2,3,4,5-tetrahydropyridine-2,6-dicarboxylate N-acetyltransferase, partial [Oscillospiraceae bacterium]|nr:2,3,4,5-tetrahydropyridine-2,6-dicarboxylate N-acetyltransferase [Oscillospiraceae bacterium]
MDAKEIIDYIASSNKRTPVKLYVRERKPVDYGAATVFGAGDKIVFGDWDVLEPVLKANREKIETY